jgi:hypothetical protein
MRIKRLGFAIRASSMSWVSVGLIVITFIALPASAFGQSWEYLVIYLPASFTTGKMLKPRLKPMQQDESGAYIDVEKTAILNKLSEKGWEVIAVVGHVGADHAVYLRRRRQ